MMVRTDKFWAPWFGVFAIANAEVSATSRVKLHFAIEGGRVVSPVGGLVDQRREIGIDGAWLGVHVGIGTIL